MSKNLKLLLLMALSLPLAMFGQTAVTVDDEHPFLDTFEGESCDWTFLNGSSNNAWAWGTATCNSGSRAIYISQDGGVSNTYNMSASTWVYVTKEFTLGNGDYVISYDWKASGDNYDYIRVGLLPNTKTPTVGSGLPSGWISLDDDSYLNGSSEWSRKSVHFSITYGRTYKICFAWRNDGSGGTNPPGAIDNVSVSRFVMEQNTILTQTTTSDFLKGTGENVVITSGYVSLQSKMTNMYDYEASTNLPQPLMNHQIVTWQDYVFCVGGFNGTNPVNTVYRAAQQESGISSWTTLNAMPVALTDMAVVASQQNLIVMGGKNDDGISNKIYVAPINYNNGSLGDWTESPITLPQAVWGARAIAVYDNIYLVGGAATDDEDAASNKVYCLKLNSRGNVVSISEVTSLPEACNGHAMAAYDSKIYVLGGHDASGNLKNTVWSASVNLDGTLGTWQAETALPVAVSNHTAVCTNGILAIIGGMEEDLPSTKLYYTYMDGSALDWELSGVVLSARTHSGASFAFGNKIFFTGGQNLAGSIVNFVRYAPVATSDNMVGKACFVSLPFDLGYPLKDVQQLIYNIVEGEDTSYEVLYRVADSSLVYSDWISAGTSNPVNIGQTKRAIQYMFRLTATGTGNIMLQDMGVTFSGYTQLAGNLNSFSVFPLSNSPYIVTEDISFTSGVHDFEAGCVIYFIENTGLSITSACVHFNGTEENPIVLTYHDFEKQLWKGVSIQGGVYSNMASSMDYTTIANGGQGDNLSNLYLYNTNSPTFSHCTFRNSYARGITLYNSSPIFSNCTTTGNPYGVYLYNSCAPTFNNCTTTGNTVGLYSYTPDRNFLYTDSTLAFSNNDYDIRMAGGTVSSDAIWNRKDNGYHVTGDLNIYGSYCPTLTIEPGNTIYMDAEKHIYVGRNYSDSYGGGIYAVGNETDSITFTAKDDSWGGLYFRNSSDYNSASSMRYCVVDKGSNNIYCEYTTQPQLMYSTIHNPAGNSNLYLYNAEINIDECHFSGGTNGVSLTNGSTATMVMTTFENLWACVYHNDTGSTSNFFTCSMSNSNQGVRFDNPNVDIPTYANRITFDNVTSPVGIGGGTISDSRTWLTNDYSVFGNVSVRKSSSQSYRLTIDAGSVLRFAENTGLGISADRYTYSDGSGRWVDSNRGELYAEGTEDAPITFTALNGESGGWLGMYFGNYCDADTAQYSLLKHCIVEKAETNVYLSNTNLPSIENCEIRLASGRGATFYSSGPMVADCEIHDNGTYGVYSECDDSSYQLTEMTDCNFHDNGGYGLYFRYPVSVGSVLENLQFSNNLADGIGVGEGQINANRTWPANDYHILGNVSVRKSSSQSCRLTIDAGSVLRFAENTGLGVSGNIYSGWNGVDHYSRDRGELYAEGTEEAPITFTALNGESGGWLGMYFGNGCDDDTAQYSLLKHCIVEKAETNVYLYYTNLPSIENCEIRYASGTGLSLYQSSPSVKLSRIHHNGTNGIYLSNSSNPTIGNNTIEGNDIVGNGTYAVYQNGSNNVDMAYNFLGYVDSLYVENNLVYDKLDNNNRGRVNVFPVSMLPVAAKTISGTLLYDGNAEYAMEGSTVMVKDFDDELLYETATDATGHFSFDSISYLGAKKIDFAPMVDVESTITTADALAVMLHFVHETMLTGSRLAAADVNGSLTVNGTDALLIQKRYVNQIETFPMGDMYYSLYDSVSYNNASADLTITALCYGDVNGSYQPLRDGVSLISEGKVAVGPDMTLEIPVRVKTNFEAGAISLKLSYPEQYLSIESVTLPNGEEAMIWADNGLLTISWYDLNPMYLSMDDVMLILKVHSNDLSGLDAPIAFGLGGYSELTDGNAIVVNDVVLAMPELIAFGFEGIGEQSGSMEISVYPNPMRDRSVVRYSLSNEGRVSFVVYDLLGNTVNSIERGRQDAGQHEMELTGLASGVYMGRLAVSGSHEEVQIVKIVVE